MNNLAIRLIITLITFFIVVAVTVFCFFYNDIPDLPPLNRDKLTVLEDKKLSEDKRESEYQQRRLKIFSKFKENWNTKFLKKFKEKSLENIPESVDESYRFIWIPSFHPSILIRVYKTNNRSFLVAKSASEENFTIGKVSAGKTKFLTKEEWNKFQELVTHSAFWNSSTLDKNDEPVNDGAYYVFEGNKSKMFHEIHRITPSREFRELGAYLINLAELKTEYGSY